MRRREFIALLGSGLVWPFPAQAQQTQIPVIGYLSSDTREGSAYRVQAFRQGLSESGYIEGQNTTIQYRWAEDHNEHLPALADDLVRRKVTVIVTG
jgi:putative ABC transport system substrate-binding protein